MSIASKTGQQESITEIWRALELFTDRREATRLFVERINHDPAPETILFFTGDGGNGKSLLLAYLQKYCSKRFGPDEWERMHGESNDALAEYVRQHEGAKPVPSALIDFAASGGSGEERPQEPFYALLMLRRALAGHGLRFPLYSFASVLYLKKSNQEITKERLKALYPDEELGFALEMLGNLSDKSAAISVGKSVLSVFNKHWGQDVMLARQRRQLNDEEAAAKIASMELAQLRDELPRLFAEDLNAAMQQPNAPERVALFFDTHEAFWGKQRDYAGDLYHAQDEWLRCLLANLELSRGIVAIVAGREAPRWHEGCDHSIPQNFLDVHPVDNLTDYDADDYLMRAGISDPAVRQSLVAYARVKPNEVHPLFAGLCGDIVLEAARRGETLTPRDFADAPQTGQKAEKLIGRLLRYVDGNTAHAVRALSACRVFDEAIYRMLGAELNFTATQESFKILNRFSFIRHIERDGTTWYHIHDLLRKLFHERNEPDTRKADVALEQYYRQSFEAGKVGAVVEAIYHLNQLDREQGVQAWLATQEQALRLSRYDLCGALNALRSDLRIESDFERGCVAYWSGLYASQLARYGEARREYDAAVIAFDDALQLAPDDINAYNNKGLVLVSRGDLQAQLGQYQPALASFQEAIAAFQFAPDDNGVLNNKGNVLVKRGDLQAQLGQHEPALASYQEAVASYNAALQLAPDDIDAHNNKGLVLKRRGDLQAQLGQYQPALASFQEAGDSYAAALKPAPDHVILLNNFGDTLHELGLLLIQLEQEEASLKFLQAAMQVWSRVLEIAPDSAQVRMKRDRLQELLNRVFAMAETAPEDAAPSAVVATEPECPDTESDAK